MVNSTSDRAENNEPTPLHELISRILTEEKSTASRRLRPIFPVAGTMQYLNQRLENQPWLDFINYTLRGIGQVIFVNNPLSGLLILVALFIQSTWVGGMSLLGAIASTLTAVALQLERETIRNGIFGYNGILVGAALATFGLAGNGAGNWLWASAIILLAALTTVLMKTCGIWWAKTFNSPPLTLPFNLATLMFLVLVIWLPQPWFELGTGGNANLPSNSIDWLRLMASEPIGFGQVFLADKLVSGLLIFLAVLICTPLGAAVGLLGGSLGLVAGRILGIAPDTLYAGLWNYNAVLTAMAIGGVFYAPNLRSIGIGAIGAFLSACVGGLLQLILAPWGLPILTLPFCLVTIGCFVLLQNSLPSLVPVALHAVTSPEEHLHRYQAALEVISNFRRQLELVQGKQKRFYLFERVSPAMEGDLRYIFDAIDRDRNGALSRQELADYLGQAKNAPSSEELRYLFTALDSDRNGSIDFAEFGELILRHRRLMANYEEFMTYFLPIDVNGDDAISLDEMNVAMSSVGEKSLTEEESAYLGRQFGEQPLTWSRFLEMLLVT